MSGAQTLIIPTLCPLRHEFWAQSDVFSCAVPILKQAVGTERRVLVRCAHFRTNRGHRVTCSLALYPFQNKPWAQSDIFSCAVPILKQTVGTERRVLVRCAHFKASCGYRIDDFLALCPFWSKPRVQSS